MRRQIEQHIHPHRRIDLAQAGVLHHRQRIGGKFEAAEIRCDPAQQAQPQRRIGQCLDALPDGAQFIHRKIWSQIRQRRQQRFVRQLSER